MVRLHSGRRVQGFISRAALREERNGIRMVQMAEKSCLEGAGKEGKLYQGDALAIF